MHEKQANEKPRSVSTHIVKTWFQTIAGVVLLAALSASALWYFGLHWSWILGVMLLWVAMPIYGWFTSAETVKKLTQCEDPHPEDPEHQRLVRLVDEIYPKTGLAVKPPVLVSPLPVPNAFATGRNPENAFIAATEGLLSINLTDEELKAILAHELAHIKSRDVAILTFASILGSFFAVIVANGFPRLFSSAFDKGESKNLLEKLEAKTKKKKHFIAAGGGIAGAFLIVLLFIIANFFAKLITLFISRSRESHADAMAVQWTGNPCAMSTALQKISLWMSMNVVEIRINMLMSGLTPMLCVNMFDDDGLWKGEEESGFRAALYRWWQRVGQQHPPVEDRIKLLDQFNGERCQRIF